MKTKLVLWGKDANDARILTALQLRPADNKVDVWTFPEKVLGEDFSRKLMNEWREGIEVPFPEGFIYLERDLTAATTLLPEGLKMDKMEIVERSQTEWHFIVLSHKLNVAYHSELEELKARIAKLEAYDQGIWEELKVFWDKVREQVSNRNMMREQADALRDEINGLFTHIKSLRYTGDDEYMRTAQANFDNTMEGLKEIENRMDNSIRPSTIFDDLKHIQTLFKDMRVTRDMRVLVWQKTDELFKRLKERRYGIPSSNPTPTNNGSLIERIQRRYEGLLAAVDRMQESINRDREELAGQAEKITSSNVGQLEKQILEAKSKMIEARIRSKEEKLAEIEGTRADIEAEKQNALLGISTPAAKYKPKPQTSYNNRRSPETNPVPEDFREEATKPKTTEPLVKPVREVPAAIAKVEQLMAKARAEAPVPPAPAPADPIPAALVPPTPEAVKPLEVPKIDKIETPIEAIKVATPTEVVMPAKPIETPIAAVTPPPPAMAETVPPISTIEVPAETSAALTASKPVEDTPKEPFSTLSFARTALDVELDDKDLKDLAF